MNGIPAITQHPWLYPALEVAHIFGIALLVGNLVAFELRVWGAAKALPLQALAKLSLSLAVAGFVLIAATGVVMFAGNPGELLASRVFTLKMGLVMLAGCNAGLFHARGGLAKADALAKAQTALSLGLWLAVMICGRWIAYR